MIQIILQQNYLDLQPCASMSDGSPGVPAASQRPPAQDPAQLAKNHHHWSLGDIGPPIPTNIKIIKDITLKKHRIYIYIYKMWFHDVIWCMVWYAVPFFLGVHPSPAAWFSGGQAIALEDLPTKPRGNRRSGSQKGEVIDCNQWIN